MTRNISPAISIFLVLMLAALIFGCGGDSAKLTGSLQPDNSGNPAIATGPRASGGQAVRAVPGHSGVEVHQPADPWAMPDLVLPERGASSVSPATMEKLEAILDKELRKNGMSRDKATAKAPAGNTNSPFDVAAAAVGSPVTGVQLTWTERLIGDYDVNGEVNIADLTPIALQFGNTPGYDPAANHGGITYWPSGDPNGAGAANWYSAGVDGDDNGEINLSDISPIAVHFQERLDGFRVYRRLDGETNFSLLPNPGNPGAGWTVGRPSVANGSPARYTFTDAGTTSGNVEYYVAAYDATTSGEGPQSNTASLQLSSGPTAVLNSDVTSGKVPLTVNFDAIDSVDDGTIVKYEFDFGEGGGFEDFGTTNLATHEYTELGTYTAVLRVTDDEANTDTDSVIINTTGQAPTAVLVADNTFGEAPLLVNLDATGSSDADGTIVKYEYDFDNGVGYQERPDTTSFTFSTVGNFTVLLRLTDDDGLTSTDELTVTTFNPGELVLPPLWEVAKANAGVTGSTMGFNEIGTWVLDQSFWNGFTDLQTMLPAFWDAWYMDVEGTPGYMHDKSAALGSTSGLQELFLEANSEFQTEHRIFAQDWAGTIDPADSLAHAIADFVDGVGGTSNFASYQAALAGLDAADQDALAAVVYGALNAWQGRDNSVRAVFGDIDVPDNRALIDTLFDNCFGYGLWALTRDTANLGDYYWMYLPQGTGGRPNFFRDYTYSSFYIDGTEFGMFEGAAQLCDAIDDLTAYLATSPVFENVSLDVDTPAGKVTIGGTGDDTHAAALDGNGHAILIDLGGNDTYDCHAGGTASSYNGAAVCIDLAGDDMYNKIDDPDDIARDPANGFFSDDDTCQQGSARFGTGVLVDYQGEDEYHGIRMAQGSGIWGVGILADYGGGFDVYDIEAFGQGGAMAGIGILFDEDGSDTYYCISKAQGFGGPEGVGYLVDLGGDGDFYTAEPLAVANRPEYDATAVYGSNLSIAQGCGWGSRWGWISFTVDTTQYDITMSGGQGLLFDDGGADEYTCGTFGQGMGFFGGFGLLLDAGLENDLHAGHWYTQGATAHVAAAGLYDTGGNDTWDNEVSIGIGGAHDMSVTWFIDLLGNDTYNASPLAIGTGYSNGFGYFIDYDGDDTYNATYSDGATDNLGIGRLGDANRPTMPSYGIFVDAGGTDVYDPDYQNMENSDGLPGDNAQWTRVIQFVSDPPDPADSFGYGAGVDGN